MTDRPPGEALIPQCETRKVGDTTYISVPGPVPVIEAARTTLQYARALGLTEDQVAEVVRLHRESLWTWEQLRDRLPALAMDLTCGDTL